MVATDISFQNSLTFPNKKKNNFPELHVINKNASLLQKTITEITLTVCKRSYSEVSASLGLVDFGVRLVDLILHLPDGK